MPRGVPLDWVDSPRLLYTYTLPIGRLVSSTKTADALAMALSAAASLLELSEQAGRRDAVGAFRPFLSGERRHQPGH